mmetsp:Transcript_36908/g.109788  ORF Transcript_36908/g.109788 Transcript_36908/m.109788 type:complete len:309 (+) Transcript_36908:300-1226(+)
MTRLLLRLCREAVERLHHTVQLPGSGILDGRLQLSRRLSLRRRHLLLRLGLGLEALPLLDQRPRDQLVEARVAHPVHAWVQAPPFDRLALVKVLEADPRRVGAAVPPPHRPVGAVLDQVIPHHHDVDAVEEALDAPHHRVLLFAPLANHVPARRGGRAGYDGSARELGAAARAPRPAVLEAQAVELLCHSLQQAEPLDGEEEPRKAARAGSKLRPQRAALMLRKANGDCLERAVLEASERSPRCLVLVLAATLAERLGVAALAHSTHHLPAVPDRDALLLQELLLWPQLLESRQPLRLPDLGPQPDPC